MTNFLRENCDQIKTIVVKTKGTPTQKLLAILMLAGIDDATELAAILGVTDRYVRKARNQSSETEPEFRNQSSENGTRVPEKRNQSSVEKKVSPTPPSKNNSNLEPTVIHPSTREDGRIDDDAECKAAFNGSTEAMLAMIESAMGGHCRKNAAQWLANLTRINGQQPVAEAFQKFLTCKAEGQIIARPLPWLDTTAKNCKRDAAKQAPAVENPFAEQTKGVKRHVQPAPDDPNYLANFGRRRPVEAARA